MLLLCSFFRLKELFQVKNGLTTSLLLFFFENAKNLGRSDDAEGRKNEDGLGVMPAKIIKKILLWLVLPDGICLRSSS